MFGSLSHTSVAFAHFNNPGALASYDVNQLVGGYDHRFGLAELQPTINLADRISFGPRNAWIWIARSGGKLFHTSRLWRKSAMQNQAWYREYWR